MQDKIKKLVLFDVDGTLIAHNPNWNEAALDALSEGFSVTLTNREVPENIGTAIGVAIEVLKANGITEMICENYKENIEKSVAAFQRIVKEGVENGSLVWMALPNAKNILKILSQRSDVKLALLTANPRDVTMMKLKSAGIDPRYFMDDNSDELCGAFGCEHESRSSLINIAMKRCSKEQKIGHPISVDAVFIGDTPHDVNCAHDNNIPCVAVTTGVYVKTDLHLADYILEDGFENLTESIEAILRTLTKTIPQTSLAVEKKIRCLMV
ncbi:unnamed protein product [Clavelina lepadiformis]|uniref:Phosphoglycolate phosphatase n=1 Tax=Clavelina lepadiformis TaxID=159417 RepID=A0ABP0GT95_CLALP